MQNKIMKQKCLTQIWERCTSIGLIIQSLDKYLFNAYCILFIVQEAKNTVKEKDTVCSTETGIILCEKTVF